VSRGQRSDEAVLEQQRVLQACRRRDDARMARQADLDALVAQLFGLRYDRWFKSMGLKRPDTLTSNSLVALIGLTVSGLGISYLPRQCLAPMIKEGALEVLEVTPKLPEMPYAAVCKADQRSTLVSSIAKLAQESCDFSRMFKLR
jgi:DNA-binding transcriptional LysR family regulator